MNLLIYDLSFHKNSNNYNTTIWHIKLALYLNNNHNFH